MHSRLGALTIVAAVLLLGANPAGAATPEDRCQVGRYKAVGKYVACQQKVLGRLYGSLRVELQTGVSVCRIKYGERWAQLQAQASGSGATCDASRFVSNGDGTVTDNLSGLQWEMKTDDASVHDKDNRYTWTDPADGNYTDADGSAFRSFLATLNGGGCFAGQCDWRLPTLIELMTIVLEPCASGSCIDPIFGPVGSSFYWSSTTYTSAPWEAPAAAWYVIFGHGDVYYGVPGFEAKYVDYEVRAVRGGL